MTMSIRTERLEDRQRRDHEAFLEEVRAERIRIARRTERWEEIPDDLVKRQFDFWVSASSDRVYTPVRGLVFAPESAAVVDELGSLYFTVRDAEIVFWKREKLTWSEMIAKRARKAPRK